MQTNLKLTGHHEVAGGRQLGVTGVLRKADYTERKLGPLVSINQSDSFLNTLNIIHPSKMELYTTSSPRYYGRSTSIAQRFHTLGLPGLHAQCCAEDHRLKSLGSLIANHQLT